MACKAVDEKAEFEASKQTVRFEIAQNAWRYDVILPEDLHAVAFQQPPGKQMLRDFVPFDSVGLGNPLVATSDR